MNVFAIACVWWSFVAFLVGTSYVLRSEPYAVLVERHLEAYWTLAEPLVMMTFLMELGVVTAITIKEPVHWHAFPFLFAHVLSDSIATARAPQEWMRDDFLVSFWASFYTSFALVLCFYVAEASPWWVVLCVPIVVYVAFLQVTSCLVRWHKAALERRRHDPREEQREEQRQQQRQQQQERDTTHAAATNSSTVVDVIVIDEDSTR